MHGPLVLRQPRRAAVLRADGAGRRCLSALRSNARIGEYELPARRFAIIACGNREGRFRGGGAPHADPARRRASSTWRYGSTPRDWLAWGAANGIAAGGAVLHPARTGRFSSQFDPQSKETGRFSVPEGRWHFTSNIVHRPQRARCRPVRGARCCAAPSARPPAVEFAAFLKVWRELPHPRAVIGDPENADIPEQRERADGALRLALPQWRATSTLDANRDLCGRGCGARVRGVSLVGSCVRRGAGVAALARLHPLGRRQDPMRENAMHWSGVIGHYPAGDRAVAQTTRCGRPASPRREAEARRRPRRPPVDAPLAREERAHEPQPTTPCRSSLCASPPGPAGSTTARRATTSPSHHEASHQRRALQQAPAAQRARLRRAHRDGQRMRGPKHYANRPCRGTTRARGC